MSASPNNHASPRPARPGTAGLARPGTAGLVRPGTAGAAGSPQQQQGGPRVIKYDGAKDERGVPHGFGVLVSQALYYKGEFCHGKFHGRGFMRRFGPPGSANETSPNAAAASPNGGGSASPQLASPRHLDATANLQNTVASPISARPSSAGGSAGSSPTPMTSPRPVKDRGSRAAVWTYYGDFQMAKRHGFGKILFHRTGEQYEGHWADDVMKGEGIYTLPSTGTYTGTMANSRRHGIGTMLYIDGSGYRGHWFQDVIHGGGRLVEPNGTFFDGHWNRGVMNGTFHVTKPSGSVYRRQFLDGRLVLEEKLKAPDMFQRLFEKAPEQIPVERRLAQVFRPTATSAASQPQPASSAVTEGAGGEGGGDDGDGAAGLTSLQRRDTLNFHRVDTGRPVSAQPLLRRSSSLGPSALGSPSNNNNNTNNGVTQLQLSNVSEAQAGGRETTFMSGDVQEIEVEDIDIDDTSIARRDPGAGASDGGGDDGLVKNKSFVRPLNEVAHELRPTPKNRRPHTADSRERPWSSGSFGENVDDDDDAAPGAGAPVTPHPEGRQGRRPSSLRGAAELDEFKISPETTINALALSGLAATGMVSPRGVDGPLSPGNASFAAGAASTTGPLSPSSQDLVDRMARALREDAERLGDAPVPPGAQPPTGRSHPTTTGFDHGDETLEEMQKRRQEEELDRRASIAIMRAHSMRTPKAAAGVASPRSLPSSDGRRSSKFAAPASNDIPAMTASFVGHPPPMDLGPAGADSFAAPPALSNESIVWNASTATQARPGPAGGAAVADRSPNMGPATLSMRNFSFAGSTFANSPPGPRGERPPTTTSSTAGDTPSGARMTRRRTSLAGADAGMAADNFEAPKALRPAPAPAPSAPSPPDSESLSCTRNEISFGEMGIRIASDDGKGTTDGDEDDGTPKLPDMPPPPSLAATVQRLNDSMAGPSSTSPPGRGDRSPGNDLSRARSVRFAPDSPKEAANKESASADRSALAPKRAASSLLANNTTPAPADTPKFGRRSTVHNLDQQRT